MRIHVGGTSRFRYASTRSASTRSPSTTPTSNEVNWPRGLLDSQCSPSTDDANTTATPSVGSRPVSSSHGDHSPIQGNGNQPEVHEWHETFHQEDDDPGETEESMNVDDQLPEISFNSLGQLIEDISKPYASILGVIDRSVVSPHYEDWRIVTSEYKEEIWRSLKNEYKVPEIIKVKALRMENKSWKNRKTKLRN